MSIFLRVKGPRACFARPELKVEAVTYDVMPPTAARAIIGTIYWKPEIEWIIDGVLVINPIRTFTTMLNGITDKISVRKAVAGSLEPMLIEDQRDQRNVTILRDVDYVIEAHFNILSGENNPGKHLAMFQRRAEGGQCFRRPYFGRREFSVEEFGLEKELPVSELKGEMRLGYILHSIDYVTYQPAFFNAVLDDGYMRVPPANHKEVKK